MAVIAPFATAASTMDQKARMVAPFLESFGDGRLSDTHPPFADNVGTERPLPRPKIFGPERLVEDPRIKALHARLMHEMYAIAFVGIMLFSGIIFSVPCGHQR